MPLRPTMIDDISLIDALDRKLFADRETYPYPRPVFGYYAARTFAKDLRNASRREEEDLILGTMNMRFFSLFRHGHLAGFMVLRDWIGQSTFSLGRYDERDSEVMYLGVAPAFRGTGLGSEALTFALRHHAQCNRDRTTLARFKPGCTRFRAMLARADFEIQPWPQDGRWIGVRYSDRTLSEIPRAEHPRD